MEEMITVADLFGRAGLPYPPHLGNLTVNQIVTDSRKVVPGCLFLCIKGERVDGHGFINDAINAGAAVIVAERVCSACVGGAAAYIMLDNTRRASALLYNARFGNPTEKLKIIGVTGTNGKTTVCTLLWQIFRSAGYRCGLLGTVCCRSADGVAFVPTGADPLANLTTPDPEQLYGILADMAADGVEYVFMEVSSHALALCKTDAIRFDTAVFTNLSADHLDFHRDMESYYQAKRRLFSSCREAVILTDAPYGARLARECEASVLTCSRHEGDFCALSVEPLGLAGWKLMLRSPQKTVTAQLTLGGSFAVDNALLAFAVACRYGIEEEVAASALGRAMGAEGRMELLDTNETDGRLVIVDYAHTPDGLERLLRSLRQVREADQHLMLVFGCGGDRDPTKRKEMGRIASALADTVVVTSDNPRSESPETIIREILRGIDREKPYTVIPDRRTAIEWAVANARPRDVIVLAGKGHERYEINAEGRIPFDERRIVKEAVRRGRNGLP